MALPGHRDIFRMGRQTQMNERNGSQETAPRAFAPDMREFGHGAFTLAELQAQLLVTDVRECGQRVKVPSLLLLAGLVLGSACLPIGLAALALWLVQAFDMSYATGFLIATVAGAMLSMLLCGLGWFLVRQRLLVLRRSYEELVRNLGWFKKVLERNRCTRNN